jgi:hypothetical protein
MKGEKLGIERDDKDCNLVDYYNFTIGYEKIFVIDDEHIKNPLKWKGLGLLGFILIEVRKRL